MTALQFLKLKQPRNEQFMISKGMILLVPSTMILVGRRTASTWIERTHKMFFHQRFLWGATTPNQLHAPQIKLSVFQNRGFFQYLVFRADRVRRRFQLKNRIFQKSSISQNAHIFSGCMKLILSSLCLQITLVEKHFMRTLNPGILQISCFAAGLLY